MLKFFPLELPAGCLNVVSSGAADIDLQPVSMEDLVKLFDLAIVRSLIGTTGMRVEGNDVDLAANTMQKLAKRYRIVHRIVDPAEQDIFEGNPLSPRHR
jgi:hypothetical protein